MVKQFVVLIGLLSLLAPLSLAQDEPDESVIVIREAWARATALLDDMDMEMATEEPMDDMDMEMDHDSMEMDHDGMDMSGGVSGAYMLIENTTEAPIRLVNAISTVANDTQIHETTVEDDIARMREIGTLEIPAGETVELVPGGFHVMLVGLNAPLPEGTAFDLTLTFEDADGETFDLVQAVPVTFLPPFDEAPTLSTDEAQAILNADAGAIDVTFTLTNDGESDEVLTGVAVATTETVTILGGQGEGVNSVTVPAGASTAVTLMVTGLADETLEALQLALSFESGAEEMIVVSVTDGSAE